MLVDASTSKIAPKVLAKLAEVGAELKLIVLTHYHYDHVGQPTRCATPRARGWRFTGWTPIRCAAAASCG